MRQNNMTRYQTDTQGSGLRGTIASQFNRDLSTPCAIRLPRTCCQRHGQPAECDVI